MSWWLLLHLQTIAIFGCLTIYIVWRRPPHLMWMPLLLSQLAALSWAVGEWFAVQADTLAMKHFALAVLHTGGLILPLFWWILSMRFARAHRVELFRSRLPTAMALGFTLVALSLAYTNAWHGQYLTPVVHHWNLHHWGWYLAAAGACLETFCTVGVYGFIAARSEASGSVKRQAKVLAWASALPLLMMMVDQLSGPWPYPVDLGLAGASIAVLLVTVAIYRGRLFSLAPLALGTIVTNDPSGIIVLDSEGRLRLVNHAAEALLGGLELEIDSDLLEALGPRLSLDAEGARPLGAAALHELLADESVGRLGRLMRYGDDQPRWLWATWATLRSRRGHPRIYTLRLQDLTWVYQLEESRRQLSERLDQAKRLQSLGILASGIAHEINNPIGSILLAAEYASLASDDVDGKQIVSQSLERIINEARRCGHIVEGVRRFAREETTEKQLQPLNDCVAQSLEELAGQLDRAGIKLEIDLAPRLPEISFNQTELRQVMSNLIRNAIDACDSSCTIWVQTREHESCLRLSVIDNGPGLKDEIKDKVFEPFSTSRRHSGGTGLGLSIVHGIVSDHGASIRIDSEPGAGTRVHIDFPVGETARQTGAG